MEKNIEFKKDELLELLWHLAENHSLTLASLREHDPINLFEKSLSEFSSNGIIDVDGEKITLTEEGKIEAGGIVRRHRLAERLMVDVMRKEVEDTEQAACEFEHILAPELVDSICILLGHPKKCPHGSPIPEGTCCVEAKSSIESAIIPITKIDKGSFAKVAFISTKDDDRMHKLLSIGVTPGTVVRIHQTSPVLVIEIDQNQIAIENSIGEEIKVLRATVGR